MNITPGSVVGGKYRLERPVSRGGMGSVWAAQHVQLGSTVAVKFMDPSYASSAAFRGRFEREARVAASIKSPHVVSVQDYGIDALGPYIVMELLQGEDLHGRLERQRRLSVAEAASLLNQIGKALRRAHEAGLVHRDLKPRNIFLARVDDEEIAKVLDFGIAKDTVARSVGESTSTGELMGSPHYMSPEQLRADKDLDPRSDLWGLGVILFRCLTGRLPFPGDVLGTVMARVLVDPIPLASQIAPDLPPGVDDFFARALARDRDQRFQTVREMVDAFLPIAGGAPLGVTSSGGHQSPFAPGSGSFPGPRPPLPSAPLVGPALAPTPTWQAQATPQPLVPPSSMAGTPVGTLTTANLSSAPRAPGRRRTAVWAAGGAALLLVGVGGAVTLARMAGGSGQEGAAAAAPAVTQAPAAPEPAPAPTPEPAKTAEPQEAAPEPTVKPVTAVEPPAPTPEKETAPPPVKTAPTAVKPAPKAPPQPTTGPAQTTKKPSWGF